MSAISARVAVIPGKNVIGIEMPNNTQEAVFLSELFKKEKFIFKTIFGVIKFFYSKK
jgi:S-DNA-T family DNA segregation ATPase FtsK/SpoIIIE